jgi:hypothetical protein
MEAPGRQGSDAGVDRNRFAEAGDVALGCGAEEALVLV